MRNFIATALISISITACSNPESIGEIQIGMTKQQVIAVLGDPVSVRTRNNTESLQYRIYMGLTADPRYQTHFVNLTNGRVVGYGE